MYNNSSEPMPLEKIIASLSYITMGMIGFIWFIIAVFTKSSLKPFLRYHVYQSIFLSIVYFLVSTLLNLIFGILAYIPFIKNITGALQFFFYVPIIGHLSLISLIILTIEIYLIIGVIKNEYSYIPWISDVINYNVRR